MPDITVLAIQLATTTALTRTLTTKPNQTAVSKKNILPATLPQLEKNCMVNLATGRLVSYSVTAEWNTHTLLNPQASLETSATMDVVCVALDASNVPLETINVLNVESSDHSFRCVRPSSESEVSLCCI